MITKFLHKSKGFPAVKYNMDKVIQGAAELLVMKNFGLIERLRNPGASVITNYFSAVASLNPKSRFDQVHVVISKPGKLIPKTTLLNFAERWIYEMGFAKQPYLLFFHGDTDNNHLHLVTTDVRLDGSKIEENFNYKRSAKATNKILNINPQQEFLEKIRPFWSYHFYDLPTFQNLLEQLGYRTYISGQDLIIRRYGSVIHQLNYQKFLDLKSSPNKSVKSKVELGQIFSFAFNNSDVSVKGVFSKRFPGRAAQLTGIKSGLYDYLASHYNIHFKYHYLKNGNANLIVIDHKHKQVLPYDQLIIYQKKTEVKKEIVEPQVISRPRSR